MTSDKTLRTELRRVFLIEGLPEPLEPRSSHLQIFDNYVHETRLRMRLIRVPETKEWTHILQQRFPAEAGDLAEWKIGEIFLNELEHEHFKVFEGNEIRKNRYFHEFDGRMFTFDIYLGKLWGLNRAHVEFESREELNAFEPPPWAAFEVTSNAFFDDSNLVNLSFTDVQAEASKLSTTHLSLSTEEI